MGRHAGSLHLDLEAEVSGEEEGFFEIVKGGTTAVEDDFVIGEKEGLTEEKEEDGEEEEDIEV